MLVPGLVSISFRNLAAEEIIRLVKDCDLRGIEWGGDVHVPHGDLVVAEKVGTLTREAGLQVASYGSYYRFDECCGGENGGPSMEEVIETAQALGAPAIRVWAGNKDPEAVSGDCFQSIVAKAREFAEAAEAMGMRLDFEYHDNTLTASPEATLRLLEAIGHPNARTLWQPPLQTSPEDRLAGLRQVQQYVSNLHVNHFDQDPWPDIHPLAEGREEWAAYLQAINEASGDRWVLIEHVADHSPEKFADDAAALLEWIQSKGGRDEQS
ncbi:MAG: sugar phosphate isomerase/epimerase family protein [Puniceicoccaceae bacterium]